MDCICLPHGPYVVFSCVPRTLPAAGRCGCYRGADGAGNEGMTRCGNTLYGLEANLGQLTGFCWSVHDGRLPTEVRTAGDGQSWTSLTGSTGVIAFPIGP